jgi:hypothetical protein
MKMFCRCGRMYGQPGPYRETCGECMRELHKLRPEWFDENGYLKATA